MMLRKSRVHVNVSCLYLKSTVYMFSYTVPRPFRHSGIDGIGLFFKNAFWSICRPVHNFFEVKYLLQLRKLSNSGWNKIFNHSFHSVQTRENLIFKWTLALHPYPNLNPEPLKHYNHTTLPYFYPEFDNFLNLNNYLTSKKVCTGRNGIWKHVNPWI